MDMFLKKYQAILFAFFMSLVSMAGLTVMPAMAQSIDVALAGSQEVPPVSTAATGKAAITIADDKTVKGSIITSGVPGKAAHIHTGAPGVNGPIIIPFVKTGENEWKIADGAKLTDEQYAAYKAGNLYINVHSDAYPGGEIRGQLQPK